MDGDGLGWAPDAGARAGSLVGHALAGSAAVLLLAATTPMSDLLPALRRLRVPAAVVEVASVTYRLLFVLLESLRTIREAQTARMGYSSLRRSLPVLRDPRRRGAHAVLRPRPPAAGRVWPAAGWRPGCACCPRYCPSSPAFLAATALGLAAIVSTSAWWPA